MARESFGGVLGRRSRIKSRGQVHRRVDSDNSLVSLPDTSHTSRDLRNGMRFRFPTEICGRHPGVSLAQLERGIYSRNPPASFIPLLPSPRKRASGIMSLLPQYHPIPSTDDEVPPPWSKAKDLTFDEEYPLPPFATPSSSTRIHNVAYTFEPRYPMTAERQDMVGVMGCDKAVCLEFHDRFLHQAETLWTGYSLDRSTSFPFPQSVSTRASRVLNRCGKYARRITLE